MTATSSAVFHSTLYYIYNFAHSPIKSINTYNKYSITVVYFGLISDLAIHSGYSLRIAAPLIAP